MVTLERVEPISSVSPVRPVPSRRGRWQRLMARYALGYAALLIFAILLLIPFVWLVVTSLKAPGQVFTCPPQWDPATGPLGELP